MRSFALRGRSCPTRLLPDVVICILKTTPHPTSPRVPLRMGGMSPPCSKDALTLLMQCSVRGEEN